MCLLSAPLRGARCAALPLALAPGAARPVPAVWAPLPAPTSPLAVAPVVIAPAAAAALRRGLLLERGRPNDLLQLWQGHCADLGARLDAVYFGRCNLTSLCLFCLWIPVL